jgi:hypothetical protein
MYYKLITFFETRTICSSNYHLRDTYSTDKLFGGGSGGRYIASKKKNKEQKMTKE